MLSMLCIIINLLLSSLYKDICGNFSNVFVFVFIFSLSICLFFDINRSPIYHKYTPKIVVGYIVRLFLLWIDLFFREIITLPGSGADTEDFYYEVCLIASGSEVSVDGFFVQLLGRISNVIGTNRMLLQYILMLCFVPTILFAIRSLENLNVENDVKQLCVLILCLLPNSAILSSIFSRESIICMLVSMSVYYFIRWMNVTPSIINIILAFAFALFGASFHSGVLGLVFGYLVVCFLYEPRYRTYKLSLKNILLSSIFIFLLVYLFNNSMYIFSKFSNISTIQDISNGSGRGASSYAQYVGDSSSIKNMIVYTIPRCLYFLFSPFIWQWRNLTDVIATLFNSSFYLWTIFNVFRCIKHRNSNDNNCTIALLVVAACVLFIFSWGVTNTGTAIRHRDKFIVLWVIINCCTYVPA